MKATQAVYSESHLKQTESLAPNVGPSHQQDTVETLVESAVTVNAGAPTTVTTSKNKPQQNRRQIRQTKFPKSSKSMPERSCPGKASGNVPESEPKDDVTQPIVIDDDG